MCECQSNETMNIGNPRGRPPASVLAEAGACIEPVAFYTQQFHVQSTNAPDP